MGGTPLLPLPRAPLGSLRPHWPHRGKLMGKILWRKFCRGGGRTPPPGATATVALREKFMRKYNVVGNFILGGPSPLPSSNHGGMRSVIFGTSAGHVLRALPSGMPNELSVYINTYTHRYTKLGISYIYVEITDQVRIFLRLAFF